MQPTRVDSSLYLRFDIPEIDSWTLFYRIDTNRFPFCWFDIPEVVCARLRKYSWSGLWGWGENVFVTRRFDGIDTNRFPCCRFVMPEVDLRDATPCESSWDVTCESSRIVKCLRRIHSLWVYWTWRGERIKRCLDWSWLLAAQLLSLSKNVPIFVIFPILYPSPIY